MLWAMCHGGEQPQDGGMAEDAQGMDEFDWVMKVGQHCNGCDYHIKQIRSQCSFVRAIELPFVAWLMLNA